MKRSLYLAVAATLLWGACGGRKPIVVGSKRGIEQTIVGEIVAQHLEHRLGTTVQRRLGFGDTALLHQAMLGGDVSLYPEYTGAIVSEILKEAPAAAPNVVFERARSEMKRTVLFDLMDPLGYDNRTAIVVRAADAAKIKTISEAAARGEGWKIGVSSEFQQSAVGVPLLDLYKLPQSAPVRATNADDLFPALADGSLTLIAATAADGHLASSEWKVLEDDMHVFPPQEAAILVRDNVFTEEPNLRAALAELSGKLDLATVRKLGAQVIVDERTPAEVAADFLTSAGLK